MDLRMTNASILTHTDFTRSKGQKSRGGGILWRPPSRTAYYYYYVDDTLFEVGLEIRCVKSLLLLWKPYSWFKLILKLFYQSQWRIE